MQSFHAAAVGVEGLIHIGCINFMFPALMYSYPLDLEALICVLVSHFIMENSQVQFHIQSH